ncbi:MULTISPECIES: TrbI/VirB10 family protein [unclassified Novosphingobium]|nr:MULTISPECIES: TrbI/VirB10 family protein [unclassified Novosphingobium]MBB3503316.1 type IV secretion system protein VirB10 [Novosphingobium sp. BK336]MBB3654553.1 type IV secretion system protein VirB10 [Novosphingobium sp. BK626]MBB3360358.1 type IV secretion system protein VirB10 [Novosphingobium sp. BK256]MBB3558499.1 type IV secretion system protein VirB10 [Novosphingobium sp. BK349]NOX07638.1 type IV secretion system protein VirB10 [Novosphingobium sp. SG754]
MATDDIRPQVAVRSGNLGIWAFGAAAMVGGAMLFMTLDAHRQALNAPATRASPQDMAVPGTAFPDLQVPYAESQPAPLVAMPPATAMPIGTAQPTMLPTSPSVVAATPSRTRWDNAPLHPPIASGSGGSSVTGPTTVFDAPPPPSSAPSAPSAAGEGASPTSGPERVKATRLLNPATTVTQGSVIQCVLETALDTTKPGLARAIVSRDVRGFDGSQVLVPRGSRLIGEYQSDVASGQSRALIRWTRLIRPDGVTIALQSPSADTLGRAGVKGKVNSHFLERYGGAILQSALNVGMNVATSKLADGTYIVGWPGVTTPTTGSTGGANVRSTVTVKQGASVSVFVARDLDFSSIDERP